MAPILAIPGVVEGLTGLVGSFIDRVFPDKVAQAAEREKAQLALLQMQQDGGLKVQAVQMSAILAEANSTDPVTSRARPSFLYVMYVMILMGIPMGFLAAFKPELAAAVSKGMGMWLDAVPDSLWTLFGVGYLGYAIPRTFEKIKGVK